MQRFKVHFKQVTGRQRQETGLTTVVLDGDVVSRQLLLASHTNEQWTSSPVGRIGAGARGAGRLGEKGERRGLGFHGTQAPTQSFVELFLLSFAI